LPSRKQLAGHLVLLRNILSSEGKDEQAAVEERMPLIGMDGLADAADGCLTFNRGTIGISSLSSRHSVIDWRQMMVLWSK
jgi:hypothetical protein